MLNSLLTFEEFDILLIEIKGILNSRHLNAMFNDTNDLNLVTPSHFLIGQVITTALDVELQAR